jgi:DNA-binding NarL/FixJ family response regulator
VLAREAVGKAKSSPHHVNVAGADERAAVQAETVLWLLAAVLRRRTERGWEVSDLLAEGLSRREIGEKLRISQSAVSQRAQAAGVVEEQRAVILASELLDSEGGR